MLDDRDIARIAREVLRYLLAATAPTYSTREGEAPEGYSRDAWRDVAHKIGVKRGRYHFVSSEALARHEGRDVPPRPPEASAAWTPADAAEALGQRRIGDAPKAPRGRGRIGT